MATLTQSVVTAKHNKTVTHTQWNSTHAHAHAHIHTLVKPGSQYNAGAYVGSV